MSTSFLDSSSGPAPEFAELDGADWCRIRDYHRLPPFLMTVPSASDLWMFVSSTGGLTAGRVDPDGALFPYETVDKLHDAHHHSGPLTLIRVSRGAGPARLWEPFSERAEEEFRIERNLYKSPDGGRVVFEERNLDLELAFRYRWAACDEFGWVRTATLENGADGPAEIDLLDGVRNVLPWGAPLPLHQHSSSLVEAYRRADLDPGTGIGVFALTARITDRAEAAEALRANVAWTRGLPGAGITLSGDAAPAFRRGRPSPPETTVAGRRGSYLVRAALPLNPGETRRWHTALDAGRSHVQLAALRVRLGPGADPVPALESALRSATGDLVRIVASADGIQLTGRRAAAVHHFADVLFNGMRGGVFARNYDLPARDFAAFIRVRNRAAAQRLPEPPGGPRGWIPAGELRRRAEATGDPGLERLVLEYLPLWFGRRHGDPSRPWNRFEIRVRDAGGGRALRYEGNWRDIFQNWEALARSFPAFLPNFTAKFVNASTVDGFNPYRVTRDGIDWETPDPDDPWSNIGYWGDHQIVYLLRFLEDLPRFAPGALEALLDREIFSYADVPYRLKPYPEIVAGPRNTIVFDRERAERIAGRERALGTDGRLLPGPGGGVEHVTLLEKLVVPALAKLSNYVPEGGIWMNTQRPEWNDANNALVGAGLSVVTLFHLRRYLDFLARLVGGGGEDGAPVSIEVVRWLRGVREALESETPGAGPARTARRRLLDRLGTVFSGYRETVYARGFSGKEQLAPGEVAAFCRAALAHLDHTLRANRREDGLYHAYNLLEIDPEGDEAGVRPLYEMLEGQVAALGSGLVGPEEAVALLGALFESRLYDPARRSFLLYPDRTLPSFLSRNTVPESAAAAIPLLAELLERGDGTILERDALGALRFQGDLARAGDVARALDALAARDGGAERVEAGRRAVLDLFETVFDHASFTGRSGTMYGYEGLGCIYWHMVAKLLLAVEEVALRAEREGAAAGVQDALARFYRRIRSGLGYEKSAAEYGAFPTDPYSHSPAHAGARQPGMTGQVKEEILARFGELGVEIEDGVLGFRPVLLEAAEFLDQGGTFAYVDLEGNPQTTEVPARGLAFTYCQVPVVYRLTGGTARVRLTRAGGGPVEFPGPRLDPAASSSVFARTGEILRIDVDVPEASVRAG